MKENTDFSGMLDLLICPGFYVIDNKITKSNSSAAELGLVPGVDISSMLASGQEELAGFSQGILYLTMHLQDRIMGASIFSVPGALLFLLEESTEQSDLHCLALAAREMRAPLAVAMNAAANLNRENPQAADQLSRMNRALCQILRLVGNMSDAGIYSLDFPEVRNISAIVDSALEDTINLARQAGIDLRYQGLEEEIFSIVDAQLLERALLNILSNAIKFLPKGCTIDVQAVRVGTMIRITVQDNGPGIPDNVLESMFHRYQRRPDIEDPRFGLGLGMVIVRSAASRHGGTVLVDRPPEGGTRVTFTLAIRQDHDSTLNFSRFRIDYTGEWNHALVELSDCLPAELYSDF